MTLSTISSPTPPLLPLGYLRLLPLLLQTAVNQIPTEVPLVVRLDVD